MRKLPSKMGRRQLSGMVIVKELWDDARGVDELLASVNLLRQRIYLNVPCLGLLPLDSRVILVKRPWVGVEVSLEPLHELHIVEGPSLDEFVDFNRLQRRRVSFHKHGCVPCLAKQALHNLEEITAMLMKISVYKKRCGLWKLKSRSSTPFQYEAWWSLTAELCNCWWRCTHPWRWSPPAYLSTALLLSREISMQFAIKA